MTIRISLFLLLMLSTIGCQPQDTYYSYLKMHDVPDELMSSLPEKVPSVVFSLLVNLQPKNDAFHADPTRIYIDYIAADREGVFDSLKSMIEEKSIATYKYSDTCNVILYRFQDGPLKMSPYGKEWIYNQWVDRLSKNCPDSRLPIPNFIDVGIGQNVHEAGLPDSYDLYVLDAKKGIHYPDKYYSKSAIMPHGWEHGYTKGYALDPSTKHVIFWLVIW